MSVAQIEVPSYEHPNVASHLPRMARLRPSQAAVIVPAGHDREGRRRFTQLTFEQLNAECDQVARALVAAGIRRGLRTVLMVPPSLEFFTLTFALFKIGAVPVLVDPGMGLASLKICLAEARPEAFIGTPKAHAARVILGWARGLLKIRVTVGRRLFWGGHSLRGLLAAGGQSEPFPVAEVAGAETAAILFTSGSTGVPKGAVYRHEVFASQVEMLRETFGIQPGEVDLATFPLFALFSPALGMTTLVPEMDASRPASADPAKLVAAITDFGATNMFGSPALVEKLARHGETEGLKLPSLKRVLSAGAPVRADVLARMQSLLSPEAQVFTPYGATEVLPVCSIGSDELLETREATAAGQGVCVGRPVPGNRLYIIRIDDDPIERFDASLQLPQGEVGEILVGGPTVTESYFGREASTTLAKIKDPTTGRILHRMGDLGRLDEAGRVWFCGRKAHRVQLAGKTLFSVPCESVFNQHPKVWRTALVGVTPEGGSREPLICVELEAGVPASKHQQICEELMALGAAQAHSSGISRFLFHPHFPVDVRHNAKIFREQLALWAQAQLR